MARIHRYTKGKLSLLDTVVGTDVENQKATVNIPIAAIVDLAIDYFAVNGNGDGINQSLLDLTTTVDNAITSIASYQNQVSVLTNEFESIVNRTEKLESTFESDQDGVLTISAANITNFAETIASEGFAQATTLDNLSTKVQQIIDGQLALDTYATIQQLAQTTSTLEGSIATLEGNLTAGYQAYTNGMLTTESFANAVNGLIVEVNGEFALADDVTKLSAQFGYDENGDITGISSANIDIVRNAVAGDGYASAVDLQNLKVVVEGEDGESGLAAAVQSIGEAQAGVPKIFNQDDIPPVDNPTNSVWYDTNDGNKAYILEESDTPTAPKQWVELTDERLGNLDSVVSATRTFKVDAGGNVAGMKIGANDVDGGYISFLADSFRIYNGTATETPFEIVNGAVKIKSANIGSISFGDIADAPPNLTTTIIYADDATGTNASTTKGTRTHIAFYNDVWVDGDNVAGITFDKIAGADGTSVTILGSFDIVNDLPTSGNTNGDGYLIGGNLYVWDGSTWIDVGNIQGPAGVNGINGTNGLKTASGVIFYQLGSASTPSAPSTSGVSYNFSTGAFTGLNSNWGTQSPEMAAGTASNRYWTSRFTVIESSPGSGTGTPSFAAPVRAFAFDQVVTFDSLGSEGTTVIDGSRITTGLIKNSAYPHSANHSGFSTVGMGIDLNNGSIHAEQFYINSDGTSNFKGSHSAGSIGSWVVDSSGSLQSSASNPAIVLSPSSNAGADSVNEKIRISATDLPSIAPFAASSLNFSAKTYDYDNMISSNTAWSSATSSSKNINGATYTKYISLPDRTLYVDAAQTASNTPYTQPLDGDVNISVPYNETTIANYPGGSIQRGAQASFIVEEEFLYTHGVRWYEYFEEGDQNWYREVANTSQHKSGVVEFDYEISLLAQIYRKSGSTKTLVGAEKEQLLDSGTKELSTQDFYPVDSTIPYDENGFDLTNALFHETSTYFGLWENGSATFSEYLEAGDYVIDFRLKIRVFNTKLWGTSSHADTGNRIADPRYRYDIASTTYNAAGSSSYQYFIGGSGTSTQLTTIVFKNSVPKTSIGTNGFQIRGGKGYIALGDATSTNSVAQLWGNTEVVGTLSANAVTTLSDKRFKTNIRPISDPIKIVKALNPVGYNWDFGRFHVPGLKHGFIAQEILDVVPSAVQKNEKIGTLENGLTLEYNNFIAINTAAIKELIEKIEALEQEIQTLKGNNG